MSASAVIHCGDVRDVLATLDAGSVQCVVTSPPYFALRDYGTASWEGGDAECDHTRQSAVSRASSGLDGATTTQGGTIAYRAVCGKCGATRIDRQIGLEATVDDYLAVMVNVFREVKRVLRDDATCWINVADSYAPDKNLRLVPERLAIALQADGWIVRADILWTKRNPMPESVLDRPTVAHEHIWLLTKQARYFYDADAIRQPYSDASVGRYKYKLANTGTIIGSRQPGREWAPDYTADIEPNPMGANARTVWDIATSGFSEAHFATFPLEIPRRCILAGSRVGDTVLDPFSGSGTTGVVALRYGRDYIGIELNAEYAEMSRRRIYGDAPLLNSVEVVAA